ncbi:RNA-binding protein 7 [Protobothrops mucrosquamatus]|uniref:RNA-binding protein 7 n=1 Tax=Protobothrops mucrosquamatus TaxID=103944 RepID=UPI000775641A|nr:RNA-binding protein 7 [Protobothrops mucrosquamatus]
MGAAEADRTLFVGNLDPRVTEELVFELFHQAGPVIKVKIPNDRDGKPKQFAFVNFKHEESVPYGMSLLNGIKLFGRPLKIQFRSGSSHASQEVTSPYAPHGFANGNPSSPQHLAAAYSNRFERNSENMSAAQRSFSPLDNHQTKAMMTLAWQQVPSYGGRHSSSLPESLPGGQQGYSFPRSSASPAHWRSEPPRKGRVSSHPYQSGHRHHGQEQRRVVDCGSNYAFRGNREEHYHDDRNYGGWS